MADTFFALIIPLFLLLLFGVIEFGRALLAHLTVTDAVREAGRVAAAADASVDSAGVIALIENRLDLAALDPALATISAEIRPNNWPGASGDTVVVVVEYPFQFRLLQAVIGWTGAQATINLQSMMPWRNE